jgi:hypothetical protein
MLRAAHHIAAKSLLAGDDSTAESPKDAADGAAALTLGRQGGRDMPQN